MKLILGFALASFTASAFAGPSRPLHCTNSSDQWVRFQLAVSGDLLWSSVMEEDRRLGVIACARQDNENERRFICEDGVDDRYHNNKDGYRVVLKHDLTTDLFSAELFKRGKKVEEFEDCSYN